MRADAMRNRRLLLDAAAAEFAEHGMDVSVAQIAVRAGIGKGTVFRHFATKEQLITAIFADQLDDLAAIGEALLRGTGAGAGMGAGEGIDASAEAGAGIGASVQVGAGIGASVQAGAGPAMAARGADALLAFMSAGVEAQVSDRAFCQAAGAIARADPQVRRASQRLAAVAEALTAEARREGSVRDDVTGHDIVLLINAASQATAPLGDTVPGLWRRYLSMMFDGLRPAAAHPLPVPAPEETHFTAAAHRA
ncbi:helix-turn-helix domain-containing protein [Nonomuraea sp. NEAU-A123]|uniref:helix-turn-helix domain-containing protein n=1 Tax=Nonomuraea sp. NEAU-A123 TaxID=2839649 RepID=UPI001BE422A1|nr:helix-turn-helix domain-containing protein [Nonomuraea sp. NEAU-A123]MBT2228496.1 TetR family transcriptional regulator [Nonomuraea sp. NEAU-A123]